jgi:hypothetical protein
MTSIGQVELAEEVVDLVLLLVSEHPEGSPQPLFRHLLSSQDPAHIRNEIATTLSWSETTGLPNQPVQATKWTKLTAMSCTAV